MSQKQPTEVDRQIAARLLGLRKQCGVTQEELAEKLGLTFQQVQKYENGSNRISASRLWVISQVFGVDVGVFFPKS